MKNIQKDKSKRVLTSVQRGTLVGMLLGDASIVQTQWGSVLHIEHCKKQKKYLHYKYKLFEQFIPSGIRPTFHKQTGSRGFKVSTVLVPEFQYFRDLFYVNGKKVVTKQIMKMLTLFGFALWFMDDGTCDRKRKQYRLATCCFSLEEHKIIREMLRRKFNIYTTICGFTNKFGKHYYHLNICRRSFEQFERLVGPFILFVPCMKYKLGYFKVSPQRLYANRTSMFLKSMI